MLSVEGDDPLLERIFARILSEAFERSISRLRVGMSVVTLMPETDMYELHTETK